MRTGRRRSRDGEKQKIEVGGKTRQDNCCKVDRIMLSDSRYLSNQRQSALNTCPVCTVKELSEN